MKNLKKRKKIIKINTFGLPNHSNKSIVNGLLTKEMVKRMFFEHDMIISKINLNQINNVKYLNLEILFKTGKILKYRRLLHNAKQTITMANYSELNLFTKVFEDRWNNKNLGVTNLCINIINLNILVKNSEVEEFFEIFKKFSTILFSRVYNFFLDFLKITTLLNNKHTNSDTYLFILGKIFKNLNKRKHSTYIQFVKIICDTLIDKKMGIKGIKFSISGRISGKDQSGCVKIERGSVPLNTVNLNNQFSKLQVYTIYGAYGLRLWINYNEIEYVHTKKDEI